jgi:regulator of sirC expression with transglutaminase-like and TPR domain
MGRRQLIRSILTCGMLALGLSAGSPANAGSAFYRAETEHFIIYSDASQFSTREYIAQLESFYTVASHLYLSVSDGEISFKQKPTFIYVKDHESNYTIYPRLKSGPGSDDAQFVLYSTCLDGETNAYADADFMKDYYKGDYRFVSANVFLKRAYMSPNLPAWVSAGLYSYVLNANIQKEKIIVGSPSWLTLRQGDEEFVEFLTEYVPFSQIIEDNITSPKHSAYLPAQYWLMIDYLMSTAENRQKLSRYVELVSSGRPSAQAFEEAIGLKPEFFEQLIKQYKSKGFPVVEYKVSAPDPSKYQIEKLPDYSEPVPLLSAAAQACPGSPHTGSIIERLQKVASEMPDDRYVQRELARSQILLGQAANAKAYLDSESARSAEDYDFKYLEGRYYLALAESGGPEAEANFVKARSSLGKAYKLNPTSAPILYYFARASENRPDFPNANTIMAVRQADESLPNPYRAYLNALLIKSGQMVAETSLSIDKKPTVDDYLSRAFYRPDSEFNEKLADYDAAIRLGPDSDRPYIARSALYLKRNDPTAALDDANKAVALNPDGPPALGARALVYLASGKPELALKDLDKSVSQRTADSLNEACWILATHKYPDKALGYCNRALNQSPNYVPALDSRAFAKMQLNQLEAAVEDYDRVLAFNPNMPFSLYGRGLAKIKQGKKDDGERDIQRARFLDPVIDTEFARDTRTPRQ